MKLSVATTIAFLFGACHDHNPNCRGDDSTGRSGTDANAAGHPSRPPCRAANENDPKSSIKRPDAAAAVTSLAGRQFQNPAMRVMMMTRTPTRRTQMMKPLTRKPARKQPRKPTLSPSHHPTVEPTHIPAHSPTAAPTQPPSAPPSRHPTVAPTSTPTQKPSAKPSRHLTLRPTSRPPTKPPTRQPTTQPEHPFCQDTKLYPDNGHRYARTKTALTCEKAEECAAQLPKCCGGKKLTWPRSPTVRYIDFSRAWSPVPLGYRSTALTATGVAPAPI